MLPSASRTVTVARNGAPAATEHGIRRSGGLRIHDDAGGVGDAAQHEVEGAHHEVRGRARDAGRQLGVHGCVVLHDDADRADVLVLRRDRGLPVRERHGLRDGGGFRRGDGAAVDRDVARAGAGITYCDQNFKLFAPV